VSYSACRFPAAEGIRMESEKHSLNFWLATVLGLGKAPFAPGTVASFFAGIPFFLAVGSFSLFVQLLAAGIVFAAGWYTSDKTEQELGKTDPSEIVIDELCGFLIAMLGHPVTFGSILAGFVFFRLFDIWKPWPLRTLERKLRGGLGVMADDVGAGIYANLAGLIVSALWK
jgi:phosphatidylglycerophosphatase A